MSVFHLSLQNSKENENCSWRYFLNNEGVKPLLPTCDANVTFPCNFKAISSKQDRRKDKLVTWGRYPYFKTNWRATGRQKYQLNIMILNLLKKKLSSPWQMFRSRVKGKFWTRLKRCCVSVLYDTVYCQQIVRGCERGVCLFSIKCSDKWSRTKVVGRILFSLRITQHLLIRSKAFLSK